MIFGLGGDNMVDIFNNVEQPSSSDLAKSKSPEEDELKAKSTSQAVRPLKNGQSAISAEDIKDIELLPQDKQFNRWVSLKLSKLQPGYNYTDICSHNEDVYSYFISQNIIDCESKDHHDYMKDFEDFIERLELFPELKHKLIKLNNIDVAGFFIHFSKILGEKRINTYLSCNEKIVKKTTNEHLSFKETALNLYDVITYYTGTFEGFLNYRQLNAYAEHGSNVKLTAPKEIKDIFNMLVYAEKVTALKNSSLVPANDDTASPEVITSSDKVKLVEQVLDFMDSDPKSEDKSNGKSFVSNTNIEELYSDAGMREPDTDIEDFCASNGKEKLTSDIKYVNFNIPQEEGIIVNSAYAVRYFKYHNDYAPKDSAYIYINYDKIFSSNDAYTFYIRELAKIIRELGGKNINAFICEFEDETKPLKLTKGRDNSYLFKYTDGAGDWKTLKLIRHELDITHKDICTQVDETSSEIFEEMMYWEERFESSKK